MCLLESIAASINGKAYGEQNLVALQPVEKSGFFLNAWQHIRKLFSK